IEHPAIIEPCRFLERLGARVTYLPVDGTGRIDPDDLRRAITPRTILVSIMHANNEVGTIQPIEDCARIARERGVLYRVPEIVTRGRFPDGGESDSTWRTQEARHVGSDTIAPGF